MKKTKKINYELKHFYPNFDREKLWNIFSNHEIWSKSEFLGGKIAIDKPGKGYPQGVGAVRTLSTGSMKLTEDIVGFETPRYFAYESRDGALPVNDLGGQVYFEKHDDGVLVRYKGGFNPKYFGTGWLFKQVISSGQKGALKQLEQEYKAYYNI